MKQELPRTGLRIVCQTRMALLCKSLNHQEWRSEGASKQEGLPRSPKRPQNPPTLQKAPPACALGGQEAPRGQDRNSIAHTGTLNKQIKPNYLLSQGRQTELGSCWNSGINRPIRPAVTPVHRTEKGPGLKFRPARCGSECLASGWHGQSVPPAQSSKAGRIAPATHPHGHHPSTARRRRTPHQSGCGQSNLHAFLKLNPGSEM